MHYTILIFNQSASYDLWTFINCIGIYDVENIAAITCILYAKSGLYNYNYVYVLHYVNSE